MSFTFERWPFAPLNTRLPEEEERWWQDCYVPYAVNDILENRAQWCVLVGEFQSGKSTALAALRRNWQERALLIKDETLNPSKREKVSENILHRTLQQASWSLRHHLSKNPQQLSLLSQTQLEFLRWTIEKFHGSRAFLRWLDGLPQESVKTLKSIEYEDFYPDQTRNVEGQIEELVNLSRRLDYQQVLVTVDANPFPNSDQKQEIRRILGWLEPMQHHGLKVVMALPPTFTIREIRKLSRGRISVLEIKVKQEHTQKIIEHYLTVATNRKVQHIEQLCSPTLVSQLDFLVQDEFDAPVPGAWVKILELLLETASKGKKLPLSAGIFPKIKSSFYTRFMPLRLDSDTTELGVWRGYKWTSLDRSIYDFLALLISNKGRRVDHIAVRTTKGNMHTLASRLRNAIEPGTLKNIYLKNIRGEGYWLENYLS